jgi:hypothetical protein
MEGIGEDMMFGIGVGSGGGHTTGGAGKNDQGNNPAGNNQPNGK